MPQPDIEKLLHYRHSETEVEAINLDCLNEFYPSDTNCVGSWYYHDFEWKEDKSISVHCTGKKRNLNVSLILH